VPYKTNRDLPKSVRDAVTSTHGKTIFRNVVNSQLSRGKSDSVAFASAWSALQRAGWEKNQQGKWVEMKKNPTASQVHVPSADWKVKKAEYQGRTVELNKPFRTTGESKKFAVYVQDGDSTKIVRFGDPNMEIRRDDPEARRSFRARHKCDQQTDKTSAAYWSCRMWDKDMSVSDMLKRQLNDDIFTTDIEAQARSVELGLEGEIHVHETADGQATYMPGESHEAYLEQMEFLSNLLAEEGAEEEEEDDEEEEGEGRVHIELEITIKSNGEIIEKQEDQQIVYGWASVIEKDGNPVVDRQGDVIEEDELIKAVHDFVSNSRTGKVMHEGGQTSRIVDSIVMTRDVQKALGIDLGKVGWLVGMQVDDGETWNMIKSGKLPMFSIGGKAVREKIDE